MIKKTLIVIMLLFSGNIALGQEHGTIKMQNKITKGLSFGRGMTSIGDLNQDGIRDVVIGRPNSFNQEIYVSFLDSNGQIQSETVIESNANGFDTTIGPEDDFGHKITNLGDVDGDGVPDIAVGAYNSSYSGLREGAVWLLFMNRDGTVKDYRKIDDNSSDFDFNIDSEENFGFSVGTLQDWTGNGINELLVGSPYRKDNGGFWILSLNENGEIIQQQEFSNNEVPFSQFQIEQLGSAINGIGDLNNDGIPDLNVSDKGYNNPADSVKSWDGAVYTLFLNRGDQNKIEIANIQQINSNSGNLKDTIPTGAQFGSSLVNIGDINGDTIQDIAVGCHGEPYKIDSADYNIAGKVRILFMNRDGTVKDYQAIGNNLGNFQDSLEEDDQFGRSVANVGDLNGDSVPELAVGAPAHGGDQKGSVFILFLNGVPQSSGINTAEPIRQLNTYPNPASQSQPLNIQLPGTIKQSTSVKVTIFNMNGQQVHQKSMQYSSQETLQIHLPELANGTYQLYMKAGEVQGFSKIVVE